MTSDFYKAAGCRIFATASSLVAGIVSLKLYSHYLKPEIFGIVIVALQLINYLPLVDGGFRSTVNRRLLAGSDSTETMRLIRFCQVYYSLFAIVVVLGSALLMTGYSLTPAARQSGESVLFFLALGLAGALTVIVMAQITLLVGLQAQAALFLLTGLNACINLVAMWVCLHAGAGVWAFPLSLSAGLCVIYPIALALIRQRIQPIRFFSLEADAEFWSKFKSLRREAWSFFRSEVATLLLYTIDVIAVGLMCGPKDAATYGVLSRLFSIIRSFLQTSGEAAWPIIAQSGLDHDGFATPLLRINAWIYGSVMGGVCPTLIPFCRWFLGEAWVPSPIILYLVVARYLVTGLAIPASYFLFGIGAIHSITRCIQRELIAACILAFALGFAFGLDGIVTGFLLATAFGTFYPLPNAFAQASGKRTWHFMLQTWWRALVGFLLGWLGANYARLHLSSGIETLGAGLAGCACGIAGAIAFGIVRKPWDSPSTTITAKLYAVIRNV